MADRMQLLLEAERRGILPPEKVALLAEARKRGLVESEQTERLTAGQFGSGLANAAIRMGAKGVAALPLMAMDLGVGTRNVAGNLGRKAFGMESTPDYELPSSMFNRDSLDHFTTPPNSRTGEVAEFIGSVVAGGFIPGPQLVQQLNQTAKGIFSGLSGPQQAAATFAKQKGVPFPLSSAAPGTAGSAMQQASRALLPGEIRNTVDARKVAEFLNNHVGTITQSAGVVDDVATKGQQYLRTVFAPGEKIFTETFQKFLGTVGSDAAIPVTKTMGAVDDAIASLSKTGEGGAIVERLAAIKAAAPTSLTAKEMDELYSGILKNLSKNANARPAANKVLQAIADDMDEFGGSFGLSFADDLAKAKSGRDALRELRAIPQLERLSKEFKSRGGTQGSRQWMGELFSNPNGKALAELRARNPTLYHELADAWLAQNLTRFSRYKQDQIGRFLDGPELRQWFDQNQAALKVILGAPQTKALDNFTNYARFMSGAQKTADKALSPEMMMLRGGAEGTAAIKSLGLSLPSEGAAYVLAKGLSDPSSALFRLFTEGFKPGTRLATKKLVQTSVVLGTQEAQD